MYFNLYLDALNQVNLDNYIFYKIILMTFSHGRNCSISKSSQCGIKI